MDGNNYGSDAYGKSGPGKHRQTTSKDEMDDRYYQTINSRLEVMFQDEDKREKMAKYMMKLSEEQEEEEVGNNIVTPAKAKRPKLMESTQTQLKRNKQSSGSLYGQTQTQTQHNGNNNSDSNDGNGNNGDNGNDDDDDDGLGDDSDDSDDGLGDDSDDSDDGLAEMNRNNTQTQHRPRPTLNNRNDMMGLQTNGNNNNNRQTRRQETKFRYLKNVKGGSSRNVVTVSSKDCMKIEELRYGNMTPDDTEDKYVIGVLLRVMRGRVPSQGGYQSREIESAPYNRAFMLYDAMDEFGQCFALRYQTDEQSKEFLRNITGTNTEPIIGIPVLLRNPGIHENKETLGGQNDIPLITAEGVHAMTTKSSIWTMQTDIPIKVPNEVVTRAFTMKNVRINATDIACIRSSCGHGTCDRSNEADGTSECFCMTTAPPNTGKNVLSVRISARKLRTDGKINTKFRVFQSFRFSRFLLGNMIETNTKTELEWKMCKESTKKHCTKRIEEINEDGGFNIFGWYRTGKKKAKLPPGHPQQASTAGGRGHGRRNVVNETFVNDDVKCHITRIIPVNKKYETSWTLEVNEYKMEKGNEGSDDDDDSYNEEDEEYLEEI